MKRISHPPLGNQKWCPDCGAIKPISDFPRGRGGRPYSYCRTCNTARMRRWREANPERAKRQARVGRLQRSGVSIEDYEAWLFQQNGRCAICGTDQPGHTAVRRHFDVDHDHVSGRIRGLLCQACNMGIGQLGEDVDRLRAAIAYLERARA